ncbi:hypothetical protein E4U41_002239 [Claviceps citrina]|nr:hypothetical protein E4U41_002239 [Claviceps citrina]
MSIQTEITVDGLFALSDSQLGEFMQKHRDADGSFGLPVDGWQKLGQQDRDRLAQRLQSVQRDIRDSCTTPSQPLDLDRLDALLSDASPRDDSPPSRDRSRSTSWETVMPVEDDRELKAYNEIVNDRGHPLYPVGMLDSVSQDPHAYYEMLKPFWRHARWRFPSQMDGSVAEEVFATQWSRWKNFRKWQIDNRNIEENDEAEFLAFVEAEKLEYKELGLLDRVAEIEADPNCLKKRGEQGWFRQAKRNWQRKYQREPKCSSLSDYESALKTRLARHGVTQSFHLAENPKEQDQLTTWIEYIGFESWWLDRNTTDFLKQKKKHDEAWTTLKEQGVIRENETPEFIRTPECAYQDEADEQGACKALKDAEAHFAEVVHQKTEEDPNRPEMPEEQRAQMVEQASKRLSDARDAHDRACRRSSLITDFVRATFGYVGAREELGYQRNLLDWAKAEMRVIEEEQKAATLSGGSGNKKRSRSSDDDDECAMAMQSSRGKKRRSGTPEHGGNEGASGVIERKDAETDDNEGMK